ncbi:MerR family transcriptional regulator [Streptomyces sp. NPDC086766]|uniref:MerR family transcriptional regulator n=1 Tax=Streptomyces sp. NPDC086766 TaxID=3365754 RepID=UPI003811E723
MSNPAKSTATPDVGVTTGFLARRLGVSPTTLRSWDRRYGLGPAARADGRHRRWSPDDVAMMQEMCRLTAAGVPPAEAARAAQEFARGRTAADPPETVSQSASRQAVPSGTVSAPPVAQPSVSSPSFSPSALSPSALSRSAVSRSADSSPSLSPPSDSYLPVSWPLRRGAEPAATGPSARRASRSGSGLPLGDVRQECRGLARAAVRLDGAAVQEQVAAAVRTYGLVTAWDEVLAPTLRAVGRKWQSSGDGYVEVEHLLSWHVSATVRQVYVGSVLRGRRTDSSPVVLAGLPGEHHTLPIETLCAALAERGVPVLMLGGAVPAEALVAAVRRVGPAAVALWSQSRSTASLALAGHIAGLRWGVRGARRQSRILLLGPGWGRRTDPGLLRPHSLRDTLRALSPVESGGERPQ